MRVAHVKVMIAALVLGLACIGVSYAQQTDDGSKNSYWSQADQLLQKLDLSPEQTQQIQEFQGATGQQVKQMHQKLREKRKALKAELDKPESDQAAIQALSAEMQALEAGLTEQRIQGSLQMKKILGPEQYKMFNEEMDALHKERSNKRRGQQ